MALTGNLEVFPLEEVLRLLARSKKTGCLRVETAGSQGRIFLAHGSLTLATTNGDDELARQVVRAGLASDEQLRRLEQTDRSLTEALVPGASAAALTDFVRELVVESLYRIRRPGRGSFDFVVDLRPRYATGQSFDVEVALSEAERRANEWADIETVVTDVHAPIRMVRELPDENDVSIAPATWRVLASLESGASVVDIAETLGMSQFRAAREAASLFRSQLVEYTQPATPPAPAWEPQPEPVVEETAPAWEAPSWEPQAAEEPAGEPAVETAEQGGWWTTQPEDQATGRELGGEQVPVSEQPDTDGFLESVFSQLEEDEEVEGAEDEETGFSMGLLRRRRMGAMARENGETES